MKPQARTNVSPARATAFDILIRIERESSYASELLHSQAQSSLSHLDHALATELVMGVIRWKSWLDELISRASSQSIEKLDLEVVTALRISVYQLTFLTRVPARAAINESVELVKRARKRSAAPFVNAVLRKITALLSQDAEARQPSILGQSADRIASSSAHPLWMVERWVQEYGLEVAGTIAASNQLKPATTIRLRNADAERQLLSEGIALADGILLRSARRVISGDVSSTAAFRSGLCAIQDEASQLVAALAGYGTTILDCCAAPGGKTLALADHNPASRVTAVELHPHRARLLRRLIPEPATTSPTRRGTIEVVAADARNLPFVSNFHRVLADVPCTGTGTLSRNPEIKWRLSINDIADLQTRQKAILQSAKTNVACDGRLLYSTCSLEREENEDVVDHFLRTNPSFRLVDCSREIANLRSRGDLVWKEDLTPLTRGPFLRTIAGVHPCDGFFAAIVERVAG